MVYAKGYGYAEVKTNSKVDTASLFRIASLSKFITAAGILKLIEGDKLTMETKVFGPGAVFESEYGSSNFLKYVQDIRVRDLLHHELGGWGSSGDLDDPAFMKYDLTAKEIIIWTLYNRKLEYKPGTKYIYSNIGYMVLGEVIEKISGQKYEDFIKENILNPSGVKNMQISDDLPFDRQPHEVQYYGTNGPVYYDVSGVIRRLGSAGGWIASPIDLLRVLTHVDGFNSVPDILSKESVNMLSKPSPNSDYACGFHINSNSKNWWHSGSLTGTSTWIVRTPSGYTFSILTNVSRSNIFSGLNDLIWPAIVDATTDWTDGDFF